MAAILKSGLPVLALAPHRLTDIYTDTRLIASLVDARAEGETLIALMQHAIEETRAATVYLADHERPLLCCEESGKPMIHSQAWVAELIEASGGRFLGIPGSHIDKETIDAAEPDVLLFAWCGAGDRAPQAKVLAQRTWEHLQAVEQRRVHCVSDKFFNTPATTLLDGLRAIAGAFHPSLLPAHRRVMTLA